MSFVLAVLLAAAPGIDPEAEAVLGRRKPPAERRMKREAAPAIDPALDECAALAREDSAAALERARHWIARSDTPSARHCQGFAEAQAGNWKAAAEAFSRGARLAGADGTTAARLWAQAGNAALAGGDLETARAALDQALGGGLPDGIDEGEALLDRARVRVAGGDEAGARADLDAALRLVPEDPLAWLLSATLARRMDDLDLARRHIAEAVSRAGDDASVALEEGVIAALSHDDAAARAAFQRARTLAPNSPAAAAAAEYLSQIAAPADDQSR